MNDVLQLIIPKYLQVYRKKKVGLNYIERVKAGARKKVVEKRVKHCPAQALH